MDGWFRTRVPVRFRDLDAMGHAHHTLPLIYLEEARAAFWRELRGSAAMESIDYVMAEVTVRFHARIRYPSDVVVGLAVQRVGARSFTTAFEVRSADGELLSSGSAVQVMYDYDAGSSKPIEGDVRRALESWLARHQNSSAMPADTAPIIPPST